MKHLIFVGLISTLGLCGCAENQPNNITATFNEHASLVGKLPANPLQWKTITSTVERRNSTDATNATTSTKSTMSTLYGNELAVRYARTNSQHGYPDGSVLAQVTWEQAADGRYYGAKIPDTVKSVEFVFVKVAANGGWSYYYEEYEGTPLKKLTGQNGASTEERVAYLLSQRSAVMP